jgi:hypothetical protein
VLFYQRFHAGIRDGSVTVTFRRWRRPQATAGRIQRTPAGRIEVLAVDVVDPGSISDRDARRAGYPSAAELTAALRGDETLPLYRVEFRAVHEPDPRDVLAADDRLAAADVADIERRLERLDRASSSGPWTEATLAAIAARPATRAADLAADLGRERLEFKRDVRKLKALGLTLSLEVGYRLSPRGRAYWRRRNAR